MTNFFAYVNLINQIELSENVISEDQVNIYTLSLHYLVFSFLTSIYLSTYCEKI